MPGIACAFPAGRPTFSESNDPLCTNIQIDLVATLRRSADRDLRSIKHKSATMKCSSRNGRSCPGERQKREVLDRLEQDPGPRERAEIKRLLAKIDTALKLLDDVGPDDNLA